MVGVTTVADVVTCCLLFLVICLSVSVLRPPPLRRLESPRHRHGWSDQQPRARGRSPVVTATVAAKVAVVCDGGKQELDDGNNVVAAVGGGAVAVMAVADGTIMTTAATVTLSPMQWPHDCGRAPSPTPSLTPFSIRR